MTSAAENECAIALWRFRARAERLAAARFEQLARDHARCDGHPAVQALLVKAVDDEHRHVEQCLALGRSLGGDLDTPPRLPTPATPSLGDLPPATVLTIQLVGMCALNETVSAAALAEMLQNARGGPAFETTRAILKDEIDHARIGWAHLEDASERGVLDHATVARALPRLLREAVDDELFAAPDSVDEPAPARLGGLDRAARRRVFTQAIEGLVIPGLERAGIDVTSTRTWLAQSEVSS